MQQRRTQPHFSRHLEATRALIGYTADDEALVHATRGALLPHAGAIADAVYQHLLARPETAAFFTLADGQPDAKHLTERKESLKGWLALTLEAPLDERSAEFLVQVGRAHTRRGGHPDVRVRGRYLLTAMAFTQAALTPLLDAAIADRALLVRTVAAWNKLLMVHLDLFLSAYGSAEGSAHWY
ncbi:MAG: protoglobin family protein [Dehalococcoidia bacterium]